MKVSKKWGLGLLAVASLLAFVYANRIEVLKYSLGWYTDIVHPRGPNQTVPWVAGPGTATEHTATEHRHPACGTSMVALTCGTPARMPVPRWCVR